MLLLCACHDDAPRQLPAPSDAFLPALAVPDSELLDRQAKIQAELRYYLERHDVRDEGYDMVARYSVEGDSTLAAYLPEGPAKPLNNIHWRGISREGKGIVTDDYIIYCFGAGSCVSTESKNDYMEEDIAALDEYLASAPTDRPIFMLTHFPLHFWYNTRYAPHAVDVIDVLNKYSDDHEIIFFWGHNHSDFDDGYYQPKFPGDEIRVDQEGNMRTLNFTYLAAGCTSDADYTGPDGGSASVMNKGIIVTINADKSLDFTYYTLDGQAMRLDQGPWLVRFRTGYGDYETVSSQLVEEGQTVAAVAAPEIEGYEFVGWCYWNDYSEVPFDFSTAIHRNYVVTANYTKILAPVAAPDAADCVTIQPDATFNGQPLTVTVANVGDLITAFDLSSIGYGTAIMYGFWFESDGTFCFDQDCKLYVLWSCLIFSEMFSVLIEYHSFYRTYRELPRSETQVSASFSRRHPVHARWRSHTP